MSTEFERKYNESKRIREKYPERIPVIVGKAAGCNLNDIDKKKYLVTNKEEAKENIKKVQQAAIQNKNMFDSLKSSRRINLFEQSGLLNEDNIREEIE